MSRIREMFTRLADTGRTALVTYMTAGDPAPDATVELMHALVAGGADALELGVPFSDPMADGPVIQRADERALAHGVTLRDVIDMVAQFRVRDSSTPVILMGYLNPVEALGYAEFAERAQIAGVDGVLVVDLPPEEGAELVETLRAHEIDLISLLAPTSDDARIAAMARVASGFVYYVSIKGVTGAASLDTSALAERLKMIRARLSLPVGVGFGIRDARSAAQVAECADAVIVGSAIVERIEALADAPDQIPATISAFVAELRAALDQTDGSCRGHIISE